MGVDEQLDRLALFAEMEERGERDGHEITDPVAVHDDLVGLVDEALSLQRRGAKEKNPMPVVSDVMATAKESFSNVSPSSSTWPLPGFSRSKLK